MAVLKGYQSFKMWDISTFYGTVDVATNSRIVVSAWPQKAVYIGSFTYDSWGNVYGDFRGYKEYYRGNLVVEVSQFKFDASIAQTAIYTGNVDSLLAAIGVGADKVYGSKFADKIAGFGGNDLLFGNGGDDAIFGDSGRDGISGGAGSDLLFGGSGNDVLMGNSGGDSLNGQGGNDVLLGGSGIDVLAGGAGRDKLSGQGGNDVLRGQGGNDILVGGAGTDIFFGGAGADWFVFAKGHYRGVLKDFQVGVDKISIGLGANRMSDLRFSKRGDDVLVEFSNVDILVEDVTLSEMKDASNFLF